MVELENRLTAAWNDGSITYSALLIDFDDRPGWYDRVVGKFSDWRARQVSRQVGPPVSAGLIAGKRM